ncbi:hypothetical protein JCM8547_000050 [Rhodosporidiobolus lusitaniae]
MSHAAVCLIGGLVRHVVRLAVPSSFLPHLWRDRFATLTSLCSTLSKPRSLAQRVLFEVVQFKSSKVAKSFLGIVEADKALGARVRSVRIEGYHYNDEGGTSEADEAVFQLLACFWPRAVRGSRT